jgi:hypothetical protein
MVKDFIGAVAWQSSALGPGYASRRVLLQSPQPL